ncbi:MAG: TonB-dependent receptor [Chitinophagaceae bacterium]|nr:TonB-dependent receptor [Chitinophagaceae bacterium]
MRPKFTFILLLLFILNSAVEGTARELATSSSPFSIHKLTGSFSGRITDAKTGAPIQGASVLIVDIRSGSSSDVYGNFMIRNIPEGKHLVEISHIGYNTVIENIDIVNDTRRDFILSGSIIENNAVIVTGVTGATQLKKVPFAVSVLGKTDFFHNPSSNIIESLIRIGGVSTLATGPAISKPVIRGLSYNRVLTINDGVRQEGQQWGDEHGIEIDEASVNKIELLKGPASIIYGSDAMAGVVNIITNVPLPMNSLKANISGNYQSNNNLRTLNANIGANLNGFNWNLYSSNKAAADYRNRYDGRVFNSKFRENNLGGYVGYNGKWGFSHLLVSRFNLRAGLIEGERDANGRFIKVLPGGNEVPASGRDFSSTEPMIPYQQIRHFKIASDNNIKLNRNSLKLNLGYQQNQREEFGNADDPAERSLYFDLRTITYTAQFHFAENKGWKNSIGLNGMIQQNKNKGVEQLIPDYRLFDLGIYIYTQKSIGKMTFSGGLRYDNRMINSGDLLDGNQIKGLAFKKNYSNFSGSLGMAAQLTETINLKINMARGFRAPSLSELASHGAHEGTLRYEYGSRGLRSETSLQFDAGLEYNAEHISLGISAFYNRFSHFIFYRKLQSTGGGDSLVTVNGQNLSAFQFDQRKATMAGLEATLDIHPHPLDWLHILNTFSLVDGRFPDAIENDHNMPFIPATKLNTEFRGSFNRLDKWIRNFYISFEINNTFSKKQVFSAYNTETETKGYCLLNGGIGADLTTKKGRTLFSLGFSAINLGDVAYQNHLSRLKYASENLATGRKGVFNMGRNFSLKLNIPISYQWVKY